MKQAHLYKRGVIYIMGIYITGIKGVIMGVIKGVIYINSLLLILFINSLLRVHVQKFLDALSLQKIENVF